MNHELELDISDTTCKFFNQSDILVESRSMSADIEQFFYNSFVDIVCFSEDIL